MNVLERCPSDLFSQSIHTMLLGIFHHFLGIQPSTDFFLPSVLFVPHPLSSPSAPWGLHCYISNVNHLAFVISPSSIPLLSNSSGVNSSPFPPLFFLLPHSTPSPRLRLSSQWAQPPEMPVLFVVAEWRMGNYVAFTSVADSQTQIARNLQLPLDFSKINKNKTHIHTHTNSSIMGKGVYMCPVTHNPFRECKSSVFRAFTLLEQQQKCLKINKF